MAGDDNEEGSSVGARPLFGFHLHRGPTTNSLVVPTLSSCIVFVGGPTVLLLASTVLDLSYGVEVFLS